MMSLSFDIPVVSKLKDVLLLLLIFDAGIKPKALYLAMTLAPKTIIFLKFLVFQLNIRPTSWLEKEMVLGKQPVLSSTYFSKVAHQASVPYPPNPEACGQYFAGDADEENRLL